MQKNEVMMNSLLYSALLFVTEKTANDIVRNTKQNKESSTGRHAYRRLKEFITRGDHGQKSHITTKINNFRLKSGADPSSWFIILNGLFRELNSMGGKTFDDAQSKITVIYNSLPTNGDYDAVTTVFETTRGSAIVEADDDSGYESDDDADYRRLINLIIT